MSVNSKMTAIADAIRANTGITGLLTLDDMPAAISECGGGLNFKVIPNPKPNTADENTIWVDTETVTGWYFTATQPENMQDLEVWFATSDLSTIKFNALKKDNIDVYPQYAQQMVSGKLVDVSVAIYQNGEWRDWVPILYLYKAGDECTDVTGGYTNKALKPLETTGTGYVLNVNKYDTYLQLIQTHSSCSGIYYVNNTINLSPYRKLVFDGKLYSSADGEKCRLVIWTSIGSYAQANIVADLWADNTEGVRYIPVEDLSGPHIIGFYLFTPGTGADSSAKINNLYLQ